MARDILIDGELILHGRVGDDFFNVGFTSTDVVNALARIGRDNDFTARLNSGGGIATEGAAIYAALRAHRGNILMVIEGVAASAASLIAMAGDRVAMQLGSTMMIHDPAGITAGTAKDHEKSVEALTAIADAMAEIYAEKSGKSPEEAREDMLEETWMTAEEAVNAGYADEVDIELEAPPPTAFNYRLYQHAPEAFVAMADANGWSKQPAKSAGGSRGLAARNLERNEQMETKKPGTAVTQETAEQITARVKAEEGKRLSDITAACAQAGKPEKAMAYFTEGKTLSDVVAALETDRLAAAGTKPAAGSATTVEPGAETAQQIEARVRNEMQKRMADITAACSVAGKPEKAAEYITANKSVTEVLADLQTLRATATATGKKPASVPPVGGGNEVISHHNGDGGNQADATAAWDEIIKKRHPQLVAQR